MYIVLSRSLFGYSMTQSFKFIYIYDSAGFDFWASVAPSAPIAIGQLTMFAFLCGSKACTLLPAMVRTSVS